MCAVVVKRILELFSQLKLSRRSASILSKGDGAVAISLNGSKELKGLCLLRQSTLSVGDVNKEFAPSISQNQNGLENSDNSAAVLSAVPDEENEPTKGTASEDQFDSGNNLGGRILGRYM